jgi:hypothetical protein
VALEHDKHRRKKREYLLETDFSSPTAKTTTMEAQATTASSTTPVNKTFRLDIANPHTTSLFEAMTRPQMIGHVTSKNACFHVHIVSHNIGTAESLI